MGKKSQEKAAEMNKSSLSIGKVINPLMILLGSFLLVTAFSMLSILFVFDGDLIKVLDINIGKVEASEIIYTTFTYSISQNVDPSLAEDIDQLLSSIEFHDVKRFKKVETDGSPNFVINSSAGSENCSNSLARYEMLPVGHFYWVKDDLESDEMQDLHFLALNSDMGLTERLLGSFINEEIDITYVDTVDEMVSELRTGESRVGLIKRSQLRPELKLLRVDGEYYLDDLTSGSLVSCLEVESFLQDENYIEGVMNKNLASILPDVVQDDDYDDDILLSLRMTGVTALSRNLAVKIEQSGDDAYPAEKIGDFLADADLTHTSNEVSFVEGCVPEQSMSFCSSPDYIETLIASGIDIVELTGNHNNDYGADNNSKTIEIYDSLDWMHFGGGYNAEDASKPLLIEKKGSRIAMLGYNYFDSVLNTGAIASTSRAGANHHSSSELAADIADLEDKADVIIVDFQFQECYSYPEDGGIYPLCYRPLNVPDQRAVFREAIDLGADIVIGTQAHQPQTYELYNEGIIFYGLGNIYFDQIPWIGTRQGLVLTHYFYNGELIQSRIDTTYYGSDMQPYVSYGQERELLLNLLYQAR